MKMVQCDRFKNHYYDSQKYNSCPHCAKIGIAGSEERKKGLFRPILDDESDTSGLSGFEQTVMLTSVLEQEDTPESSEAQSVAISGDISDIKTVALYGFEEETAPVVGWLVAVTGNEKGKSYNLKSGKNSIGRNGSGGEVDISLDDDHTVSRGTQAVLIYEPKNRQFLIQSSSGSSLVYHNGELLMTFCEIAAYDKITVGKTDMVFVPFCGERFSWEEE